MQVSQHLAFKGLVYSSVRLTNNANGKLTAKQ